MSEHTLTVTVHDMDTFNHHPPLGTERVNAGVQEGSILVVYGTNAKAIGWIDMNAAFKGKVYRHHWIEAPPTPSGGEK